MRLEERNGAAIQAILDDHLEQLGVTLSRKTQSAQSVHRMRVLVKKLRAWIRLVRAVYPLRQSKLADRRLRSLGRALGGLRDQQVVVETLKCLSESSDDPDAKGACTRLRRRLTQTRQKTSSSAPVVPEMGKVRLPVATGLDRRALLAGLRGNYKKTRKLARLALADVEDPEKLHRFRRWVKYLYYQLDLLLEIRKTGIKQPEVLKHLGSTLGRLHDLRVLAQALHESNMNASNRNVEGDVVKVNCLADLAARDLTRVFITSTRKLFALKPKEFIRLLR